MAKTISSPPVVSASLHMPRHFRANFRTCILLIETIEGTRTKSLCPVFPTATLRKLCDPARLKVLPNPPPWANPATDLREPWHVLCQRGRLRGVSGAKAQPQETLRKSQPKKITFEPPSWPDVFSGHGDSLAANYFFWLVVFFSPCFGGLCFGVAFGRILSLSLCLEVDWWLSGGGRGALYLRIG